MAAYCSGIRICILHRWTCVQGWGFTLHSAPNQRGAWYIAAVQPYSPAACTGLRPGDRIIEINYENICGVEHDDVVKTVQSCEDPMVLLVVDAQTDIVYQNKNECIHSRLPGIMLLSCPRIEPGSTHERKGENHASSSEENTGSLNDVTSHVDDLLSEEEKHARRNAKRSGGERQSSEGTSGKKSLFARLRRLLRRGHRKKGDHDRFTLSSATECEEVTPLPPAAKREEGGVTSLQPSPLQKGGVLSLSPAPELEGEAISLSPAPELEGETISLSSTAEQECEATLPPPAAEQEGEATLLPPAAELDEGGVTSLLSPAGTEICDTTSTAAELGKCGATSWEIIDSLAGEEPLIEIIRRMLRQKGRDTSNCRFIPFINPLTRQLLSRDSQRAACGATSPSRFAERKECAATSLSTAELRKCATNSSTSASTLSGEEPLIERIHRMLSQSGHHKTGGECALSTRKVIDGSLTLSIADGPATLSISDMPATLSIADRPATLSIADGPATLSIADGPATLSIADGPATLSIADVPATLSIADGPATLSITDGPVTLSPADKLATLSLAHWTVTSSIAAGGPANLSTPFISTFSIHLKPVSLPQRKHVLYQLFSLPPSYTVERRRLCGGTSWHIGEPATAFVPGPLTAVLRKY